MKPTVTRTRPRSRCRDGRVPCPPSGWETMWTSMSPESRTTRVPTPPPSRFPSSAEIFLRREMPTTIWVALTLRAKSSRAPAGSSPVTMW